MQLSLVTNQLTLTTKSCPTVNRIISYSNLKFDSERQNKSKKRKNVCGTFQPLASSRIADLCQVTANLWRYSRLQQSAGFCDSTSKQQIAPNRSTLVTFRRFWSTKLCLEMGLYHRVYNTVFFVAQAQDLY